MLKGYLEDKKIAENLLKKFPILTILLFTLIGIFLGAWLVTEYPRLNFFNKQAPQPSNAPKNPTEAEINLPILVDFEKTKKSWNLNDFTQQNDGFYCPPKKAAFKFYYAWYKSEVPLLSNNLFKISTRPRDLELDKDPGDLVIKLGENLEYSEIQLPARNRESAPYKQRLRGKFEFFQPGLAITTPVKKETPIEILSRILIAEGNRVKAEFSITYISDTPNSTRITDPLTYPPFTVEKTRVEDELTKIGVGTDKNTCFKIDGYNLNLSNEEAQAILDQY